MTLNFWKSRWGMYIFCETESGHCQMLLVDEPKLEPKENVFLVYYIYWL
jgi:hypothetical protein